MTPDVNVLVAASRKDHPLFESARHWLESATAQGGFKVLPMVATSFVRIVTNIRVFPVPTPSPLALNFIDALLEASQTELLSLGDEWEHFGRLVKETGLTANSVPDAWIAAAVLHHGEHLVTFDKGFRKMLPRSRVTVLNPSP
jgi:uncharacterized protein